MRGSHESARNDEVDESGAMSFEDWLRQVDPELKPDFPGGALLAGDCASEVLSRIADGDPLGVDLRCARRLRERALLLAQHRVLARSLAWIARSAIRYRGQPELDEWIATHVDLAIDTLLDEDREDERVGHPLSEPLDPRFAFVSEVWGVEPSLARKACIAFNALPLAVRRTYWAVVVDGQTLRRHVAEGFGPRRLAEARLRRAITALGTFEDPGGTDPLDESVADG
jgi:hypothetical protein